MKHLSTEWFGPVLLDGESVVEQRPWPADAGALAKRYASLARGDITPEEQELAEIAASDGEAFTVHDARLIGLDGATRGPMRRGGAPPKGMDEALRHEAHVQFTVDRSRDGLGRLDLHIQQAVAALDDMQAARNLMHERLDAWLLYNVPDLALDHEHGKLVQHALKLDDEAEGVGDGAPLHPGEHEPLAELGRSAAQLGHGQKVLENWLEDAMKALAPNLVYLVGSRIGAQLVHLAGGLDRLARMPTGTIQTLGAEKALFAHLTEGAPPPKHGVLFTHPLVNRAHPKARGAIARALASAIAQAVRADAITGGDVCRGLMDDLKKRAREAEDRARRNRGGRGGGRGHGNRGKGGGKGGHGQKGRKGGHGGGKGGGKGGRPPRGGGRKGGRR